MHGWPSGKAKDCKSFHRRFESDPVLSYLTEIIVSDKKYEVLKELGPKSKVDQEMIDYLKSRVNGIFTRKGNKGKLVGIGMIIFMLVLTILKSNGIL